LKDVFKKLAALNIRTVELGTGNYPGDPHCKLSMLDNAADLREFKKQLSDEGFSISALSCHGNPLHPDADRARHDRDVNRKTILLAEQLGVPVVVDFSGCPGDSPAAKYNWVTCPWPPEYLDAMAMDEISHAVLDRRAKFAADHG
jgi:sugar phosphate isomerase/epimerase